MNGLESDSGVARGSTGSVKIVGGTPLPRHLLEEEVYESDTRPHSGILQ